MATKKKTKPLNLREVYTAPQSAQVLGLSVKRVRQLLKEGKLKKISDNPVTIDQLEVIQLRAERERIGKASSPADSKRDAIAEQIASLNATFIKQLEIIADSNKRNEENYLRQINDLSQEVKDLRARKWWRR